MAEELTQPKRRGRPKGCKDKKPRKKMHDEITIRPSAAMNAKIVRNIGDEKVAAFVQYHLDCLKMRQGVNKKDAQELYDRFLRYLEYCAEHGVIPNNMNAYLAIGVSKSEISEWKSGTKGTEAHRKFAQDITSFFASIHEQGAADGIFNPISSIFWQKAHDGMVEAQKLEVSQTDPLGETKSGEEIAKRYEGVDLPE